MDFWLPLCYPQPDVTKSELRQNLLRKLHQQPEQARLSKSDRISRAVRRLASYRKARVILCYAAFDGEVETRPLLEAALAAGKRVAVPLMRPGHRLAVAQIRCARTGLSRRGRFGVPEPEDRTARPVDPGALDLVVVPGLAFDRAGRRLGRGKGYFDRFLARVPARVPRVGLAFSFQILDGLPSEPHDQPVGAVVTERGVLRGKA